MTLSSDWDVNAKSPLIGIRNALTRGRQAVDVQVNKKCQFPKKSDIN